VAPSFPIETERLRLRLFAEADFEALLAMQSHPEVARWLYWEARDADAVRTALAGKLTSAELAADGDRISLAVVLRESGEVIGDCSLAQVSGEHRQAELGYIFNPGHHGRGYATEAARELLRLAFGELGFHRVFGRIEPRNTASARVLERLGMRQEAHLVENEFVKGEWQSEAVYAILAREWREGVGRAPA
jgi:RimJ/RimL family protein N-acetyltransferase